MMAVIAAQIEIAELDAEFETAQPFGQLAIVEPTAMPVTANAGAGKQQDRQDCDHFDDDQHRFDPMRQRQSQHGQKYGTCGE